PVAGHPAEGSGAGRRADRAAPRGHPRGRSGAPRGEGDVPRAGPGGGGHGGLIRGSKAAARAARERDGRAGGPLFATVWAGLSALAGVLADALGSNRIRTGEPVTGIERSGRTWVVRSGTDAFPADSVILATPAFESARLLRPLAA